MNKFAIALMLSVPNFAFAHGVMIDAVKDAVVASIDQFKADDEHAIHIFTGIKEAKVSGAKVIVKFTVNTSAKTVEYSCVMDHSTEVEKIVCKR